MSEETRYNGWTNYETWLVKLWMDNEQGANDYWEELALECMANALDEEIDNENAKDNARNSLAERLQDQHEDFVNELLPKAGFATDLMSSALGRVNWREIAEHYVDEIPVYCVGFNMPGYMPDSEPAMFLDFDTARESIKESFERNVEADESVSEEQINEVLDGIASWKDSGKNWGFTFGNLAYWIVQN
jgi:hypothetical protein